MLNTFKTSIASHCKGSESDIPKRKSQKFLSDHLSLLATHLSPPKVHLRHWKFIPKRSQDLESFLSKMDSITEKKKS